MSATVLLAISIVACDVLLYILYQWTYGEKQRGFARRSKPQLHPAPQHPRPFVVSRCTSGAERKPRQGFEADDGRASNRPSKLPLYRTTY